MLNFFRGGHLDGQAYETAQLLTYEAVALRLEDYRWTYETKTSPTTGRKARVWEHKASFPDSTAAKYNGPEAIAARATNPPVPPVLAQPEQESTNMARGKKTVTERRTALGLGRDKLASRAGITTSQLWRVEQNDAGGEYKLKEGTLESVTKALDELEAEAKAAAAAPAPDPS